MRTIPALAGSGEAQGPGAQPAQLPELLGGWGTPASRCRSLSLDVLLCGGGGVHVMVRGQVWSQFSATFMWDPGTALGLSGLIAFTHGAILLVQGLFLALGFSSCGGDRGGACMAKAAHM